MPADPSAFGLDVLIAPLGFVAFICGALGYAMKEYRAGRAARVGELEASLERVESQRDKAQADLVQINEKMDHLRSEVEDLKETSAATYERLYARHTMARRLLLDKGVPEADLP